MPVLAGQAHPRGPENRPFAERTVIIYGDTRDCVLSLGYPQPDGDIVDWTSNGHYDAVRAKPGLPMLMFDYEYRGHFWQGDFGDVSVTIETIARKPDYPPWKDLESLLQGIRLQNVICNEVAKHDRSDVREERLEPFVSELNGIPCVRQYVSWGYDPQGKWLYYFPIDEDHALILFVEFVDNKIPGQPPSDWRPRAEAFANRLLATVQVHWKPRKPEVERSPSIGVPNA